MADKLGSPPRSITKNKAASRHLQYGDELTGAAADETPKKTSPLSKVLLVEEFKTNDKSEDKVLHMKHDRYGP